MHWLTETSALGWLATVVFLGANGVVVELDDEQAFRLIMDAAGWTLDVDGIAETLAPALRAQDV